MTSSQPSWTRPSELSIAAQFKQTIQVDTNQLASRVLAGHVGAVALAISLIEVDAQLGREVLALSFLALATAPAIRILDAAGFEIVIVETVGPK